jgi:hypothetical protein
MKTSKGIGSNFQKLFIWKNLILRQMVDASLIKKQGRGKTKRYVLNHS